MRTHVARALPGVFVAWAGLLGIAVWLLPSANGAPPVALAAATLQDDGAYVGSETCAVCHQDQYDDYRLSIHYQTETGPWTETGCESCHGPGEAHIEDPEDLTLIFSFSDPSHTVVDRVGRCLNCHEGESTNFTYRSSEHMNGTIDCASCHKPHVNFREDRLLPREVPPDRLFLGAATESCLGCHQEVRAEMNLNERHRVLEGMVTCAECHKQHEPSPRARLGGFKQETCLGCHTDKGGPFVFEHLSQRVDGCTSCHQPHGSVNRHMLEFQSVADLCYSCHIEVPSFHRGFGPPNVPPRFDSTTNCTNCHVAIHGSNLDHAFLQ